MRLTIWAGRVGKDAEVKKFDNDRAVVNFSIAHSERWTDRNGVKQERTFWAECAWWRTHAQADKIAPHIKKGSVVAVQGDPEARAYINQEGKAVAVDGINVKSFTFESSAPQAITTGAAAPAQQQQSAPAPMAPPAHAPEEDDLPFG